MATKKRSGEEINDRQILCGMGIKLRRLTAGKVTFKNVGDRNAVIITATPRSGGAIYQTQVRVKGWWVNHGNNLMQLSQAENYCSNQVGNGYTLPRADLLSNGHMRREIGSLYGEWGDMGNYMNEADFYSMVYWSSNSAGAGQQYIVSLETGTQNTYQTHEFFMGRVINRFNFSL